MHLTEFQAWFDGFTEEMSGPPSADQWKKIKRRVREITADFTPAPIVIEKYIRPYRRFLPQPYWAEVRDKTKFELKDWMTVGRSEFTSIAP